MKADREVMQQALEALESDNPDIQLRAAVALRRALEAEPERLFSLQVGANFVLRRNKKAYTLVELQWTPGMGTQYICKDLKTGKIERLHHSVLVEKDKAGKGV